MSISILADVAKLSTDAVNSAALQGQLQTAQATVTTIQAQIDAGSTTVTADDTQLSLDLQTLGVPQLVQQPDSSYLVYQWSAAPPGFTTLPAVIAT